MNAVEQAMAQAAEAAKNLQDQANQVVATQPQSTAVSTAVGSFDDDDDTPSGLVVDRWIRVCPDGVLFDKTHTAKQAVDKPFRVAINTQREVGYRNMFSIAWGNPTKYAKTYNNPKKGAAFDTEGRPWTQVIAQAKAEDPKAYDYQTAEVAMTLLADTSDLTAGKVVATSFSSSQATNWFNFLKEVAAAELKGQVVEVEIGHQMVKKGNYKPWGVYTFKLIGAYADQAS